MTELVRIVTLFFRVAILVTISTDPENGAIPKVVGTGLAPSAVNVGETRSGIDLSKMRAKFVVGNEKSDVVVVLEDVLDTLIRVRLRKPIDRGVDVFSYPLYLCAKLHHGFVFCFHLINVESISINFGLESPIIDLLERLIDKVTGKHPGVKSTLLRSRE